MERNRCPARVQFKAGDEYDVIFRCDLPRGHDGPHEHDENRDYTRVMALVNGDVVLRDVQSPVKITWDGDPLDDACTEPLIDHVISGVYGLGSDDRKWEMLRDAVMDVWDQFMDRNDGVNPSVGAFMVYVEIAARDGSGRTRAACNEFLAIARDEYGAPRPQNVPGI
jgi:hypothetical protein